MRRKYILTCAVTGNITTPEQTPHLPITPAQIADAAIEAAKAGAAVAHIHVRDPATGRPSMSIDLYREVMDRIRASGTDVVINLTTGPGGRFVPSLDNPREAAAGSTLLPPDQRVAHIVELKPEIATLDLNTMWSGSAVVINAPWSVTRMAELIYSVGTIPELEVFDSGDIGLAKKLMADGVLKGPCLFQVCMGIRWGFDWDPATLHYAKSILPAGSPWAAFAIGRMEFPMLAQAWLLGGHVRVGLEDNIYLNKGELAVSNTVLVERAVRILRELGAEPMTAAEARAELSQVGGWSR
ncbi:BKACE family enzyme [Falsiroseomonas selenitidurans]|uniref:3-keto-5-aminohexanoate cleavage protein n=1 Tax=Falsiroseomonas selenitidurans TaxID=2716335 RepID=A0ABX1E4B9_9PROT|nr:3-keto-5-aminohexanoate cleavage protein [Falsiroseomonas selenitidurans]NKC32030.1 3-keto-5-aminohexanoate cleavage protein [Falsiroseomonas selenitidurans]